MPSDYTGAQWLPCKNFWPGTNTMKQVVIHGTASGGPQTGYELATGSEFNDGNTASVHYINDVDGTVYQIVQETDAAWGNCCVTGIPMPTGYYPLPGTSDGHLTGLDASLNYNRSTISIENVKHSSDNSESLTDAQYKSLVTLVADICTRRKILPVKGSLIGHFDLDPVNKARCPGTFDWSTFYHDVQVAMGYGPMNTDKVLIQALIAGFRGSNVETIVAIAQAESGLMQYRQGVNADGTLDRGILQFNSHWHPEVTDTQAYSLSSAMASAFTLSGGTDFSAWNTYKSGAYTTYLGGINPVLSSTGEVADFCDADQFQPAKTQGACGAFALACVDAAAPVGKPCTKTPAQVVAEAEAWYAQMDGDNSISNFDGLNLTQMYALASQAKITYYPLNNDLNQIRSWVRAGHAVIINATEDSYFDLGLNDTVPYYWSCVGCNHIITITGVASDGNFLVRDSANVTDLNNPTTLRPGPRKYDASKMNLNWAFATVMHGQSMPIVQGGVPTMGVPTGWTDDGKLLHNPANKFVVAAGFRTTILNWPGGWETWNVPLEDEHDSNPLEQSNTSLGEGHSQVFRNRRLEYDIKNNNMFYGWLGSEYLWYVNAYNTCQASLKTETAKEATDQSTITSLNGQVEDLKAQLAASVPGTGVSSDEQTAINNAINALVALQQYKK